MIEHVYTNSRADGYEAVVARASNWAQWGLSRVVRSRVMKQVRPTLAYKLSHAVDETLPYSYDEVRQLSVDDDGHVAVMVAHRQIETFAEADEPDPEPIGTDTRAERDPSDAQDGHMSAHSRQILMSGANRDRPDPIETVTKAAEDPGDVQDSRLFARLLTEARADPDDEEQDGSSSDDLVTGFVAF